MPLYRVDFIQTIEEYASVTIESDAPPTKDEILEALGEGSYTDPEYEFSQLVSIDSISDDVEEIEEIEV